MSCVNLSLRQSGATSILRPDAVARTPFGTPFFKLVIDPNTDTGTFVKPRMGTRMREEIRAWEKLQRTGRLPKNRSYAAVLQRNRFAGSLLNDAVDTPSADPVVDGGLVVGGTGYPNYSVPDVGGPGEETGVGEPSTAPTDDDEENNEDRLWPDTYSIGPDSDIDYILDGFVVIDMADATGSVFWNQPRRRRGKVSLL